jgi:hypothetical protein
VVYADREKKFSESVLFFWSSYIEISLSRNREVMLFGDEIFSNTETCCHRKKPSMIHFGSSRENTNMSLLEEKKEEKK